MWPKCSVIHALIALTYQSHSFAVANFVVGEDGKESSVGEEVHYCYDWNGDKGHPFDSSVEEEERRKVGE